MVVVLVPDAFVQVVLLPHSSLAALPDANFVAVLVPDANLAAVFLHHPNCSAAAAALETDASLGVPNLWESCLAKGSLSSVSASLLCLLVVLVVTVPHTVELDLLGSMALALDSPVAIAGLLVPLGLEACQS